MPSTTGSTTLPLGVVCTDAIEQLDSFVPSSIETERRRSDRRSQRQDAGNLSHRARARVAIKSAPSGYWQIVLTSIPLLLSDALSICVAALLAAFSVGELADVTLHNGMWIQLICLVGCQVIFATIFGLYPATGLSPVMELRQAVSATASAFGTVVFLNLSLATLNAGEVLVALVGFMVSVVALPIARLSVRQICAKQPWWGERAVIIGAGSQGRALYRFYERATQRGLRPVGIIDLSAAPLPNRGSETDLPHLGSIRRLEWLRRRYHLRWAIVAPGGCEPIDMSEVMSRAANLPNLLILPSQLLLPSLWASTRECGGVMGVHLRDHLQSPLGRVIKRSHDVVLATLALIGLSPLFLVIAVWIKWNSPGRVFYGHPRVGKDGEMFRVWKFRSMVMNADAVLESHLQSDPELRRQWTEDQKLRKDPRIIPGIGNFIRKTSLDELPQLWNVLVGEMSLVGPRPIVQDEIAKYRESYPLYQRVRPGITGLWQVSGRNDTSYSQRVRLDSYYVCNWSIWLDIYILIRTVRTMIFREGAY
ncbi:undecaprenyl-phosphate galactose phosphotransferase WbaP [Allorhodopirellula solitaria]|uniref:UDP-glucose:undecaprenyl-phosphate glucose-1-phosphate transferase n=1 Tax=Allorhodopirellula solitaria TaxID=2527987 RepID=A0A5C5WNG6_9BACT|nr:undecaprenyl-phosphate galactose phosphotransferase WbaP [Allorhodopirellula solitaria]TWT52137.1 UDP-glucose:undecaprenyl-phosphate glucose-1-phosphate transferase [Allorhodopirellula solitaria]